MSEPVRLGSVAAVLRHLSRELEREGSALAHVPADVARVLVEGTGGGCRGCGGPVEAVPLGRPRVYCRRCRPPARKSEKVAR